MFNGVRVGLDFDFGLGESCFTFVGYDHFHEGFFRMRGHEWGYHIGHERLHAFYGRSVIRNEFRKDEHGRFVNNGIGHDRIEHLTHVTHSNFEERHPVGDRNQLAKQREEHAFAGNNGHPGAGNGGRSSEINSGSHVTGGGAGNAAHNESHNEAGNAGHLGAAHTDNGSVSKVFRPPTSGSSGGSNNSSHGNTGNTSNSKGNQNKK